MDLVYHINFFRIVSELCMDREREIVMIFTYISSMVPRVIFELSVCPSFCVCLSVIIRACPSDLKIWRAGG